MVENINNLVLKNQVNLSQEQIRQLADGFFSITKRALDKYRKSAEDKQDKKGLREVAVLENLLNLNYEELGDSVDGLKRLYEGCYPAILRALRYANTWNTEEHAKLYAQLEEVLSSAQRGPDFDYFVRYFLEKSGQPVNKYQGESIEQALFSYIKGQKSEVENKKSEKPEKRHDALLALQEEHVSLGEKAEIIDGLDLELTSGNLIKHRENALPKLRSLPKNERLIPSDEIMINRNRLEKMRVELFEKQEDLAKIGLLSGIFQSKKKKNLIKEIADLQKNIGDLEAKNKINEIRFVLKERSAAFDLRVDNAQEEKPKSPVKKLFAFYEKFFMKKILPEKWRAKLEKQGFLGKLLANACTLNTAISFSLLGGGLAVGGASIVGASILSGRRFLSGTATGVGSYNLLKLGSKTYAQTHGWDKHLSETEIKGLSLDQTIKYLAHYEANVLFEGRKVDGDPYYNSLTEHFSSILDESKAAFIDEKNLEFDELAWKNYGIEKVAEIDLNLQKALKAKNIKENRLKGAAVLIGITVGSGLFQKAISHLFNWGEAPAAAGSQAEAVSDMGGTETLLAEQEIPGLPELPPAELDLMAENQVDQSLIPELAGDSLSVTPEVPADLFPAEDIYNPPQPAMDSIVEASGQTAEMLKHLFIENHPIIESAGGDISVVGDKIKVVFDIYTGGDFELKQQALRRVMMDVFPVKEVLDADGFSFVDAGRVESNVATFTKLLEARPFHGFDPSVVKDIIKMEGNQLVISDYARLEKISAKALEVSKTWVPDMSSGFVRVAKNTNEKIWESLLDTKLQNIKT